MNEILKKYDLILMEAAIVEQLRRTSTVTLHPILANAPLIYDDTGRAELHKIYQGYIDIAFDANLPFLMCTPTWRADRDRVNQSNVSKCINLDAGHFMQEIRSGQARKGVIKIGGMIGCKNDCYKSYEGLSVADSEHFHSWQINQLAKAGVDFLIAETLPNTGEATGIAKAMEKTGIPYIISFVISRDGKILDGTDLSVSIDIIDSGTNRKPLGYMINCAYPTFLCAGTQPADIFGRLIGCQANGSSMDQSDLDGTDQLQAEDITDWGNEMLKLNRSYGVKILGGCCGTGKDHLRHIASH